MYQLGRTFEAVLFDMDGTLLDSAAAVTAVWTRWAERMAVPPREVIAHRHGRLARDTITAFAPHADVEAELAWVLVAELDDPAPVTPIPGAASFLGTIDVPWAIVTSADCEVACHRLVSAGLPVPTVLMSGDRVQRGKPDPEGYLAAARALEVRPHDCLVFENAPVGVSAARRAGMSIIGVATTHRPAALFADAVVDDYTTILPRAWCREPAVYERPLGLGPVRRAEAEPPRAKGKARGTRRLRASA